MKITFEHGMKVNCFYCTHAKDGTLLLHEESEALFMSIHLTLLLACPAHMFSIMVTYAEIGEFDLYHLEGAPGDSGKAKGQAREPGVCDLSTRQHHLTSIGSLETH